jgi:hypothetical protein
MRPFLRACRFMPQFVSGAALLLVAAAASAQAGQPAPSDSGSCGRISVFDVAPRNQDLYRARLMSIDGRTAGPVGSRTYRVPVGRHTLEVAEAIDVKQFDDVELRQRDQRMDRYKTLEVDVKPDTTYLLAARLIESGRIADGSYWEPVIYGQDNERCK